MPKYPPDILIRPARVADVPALARIINDCAEYGLMLHRSYTFLYEQVRDFVVAVDPDRDRAPGDEAAPRGGDGVIVGVCGLSIVWANLAEVYSLAVAPSHRRMGLGGRLVEACIAGARELGIRRLMTLTYEQVFFEKLGFSIVDRQTLPLKVWNECLRCSKRSACDEIAMIRVLEDVPENPAPRAEAVGLEVLEPPVVLGITARRTAPNAKMDEAQGR